MTTPSVAVLDQLEKMTVVLRDDACGCAYQGHEFGAHYLDSVCIEGYLWDADSGDAASDGDGWVYTNGGEAPCPHCNHEQWLAGALEELEDRGFNDQSTGVPRSACPHPAQSRFEHAGQAFAQAWLKGWDLALAEDATHQAV